MIRTQRSPLGAHAALRIRLPRPQALSRPVTGATFATVCAIALAAGVLGDAVLPRGDSLGSMSLVVVAAAAWLLPGRLALLVVLLGAGLRVLDAAAGWTTPVTTADQLVAMALVAALIWRASAVMAEAHRRAAEKARLYHLASHELRSPITAISGYLQLMEEGLLGPLPPALDDAVPGLLERTRRITELVEDVIIAGRPDDDAFVLRAGDGRRRAGEGVRS